jgi:hypothetical protein
MDAWQRLKSALNTESVMTFNPAGCSPLLHHLSTERSSRAQPGTVYAGKETNRSGLDHKKLGVGRRGDQAVEVVAAECAGRGTPVGMKWPHGSQLGGLERRRGWMLI